jgi:hypothetical protein
MLLSLSLSLFCGGSVRIGPVSQHPTTLCAFVADHLSPQQRRLFRRRRGIQSDKRRFVCLLLSMELMELILTLV